MADRFLAGGTGETFRMPVFVQSVDVLLFETMRVKVNLTRSRCYLENLLGAFRTVRGELFEIFLAVQFPILFDETAIDQIDRTVRAGEMIDAVAVANGRYERTSMYRSLPRERECDISGALPDLDLTCIARGHLIESIVTIQ